MSLLRTQHRALKLHEIIEELENDDDSLVPDSLIIFPPENCNADVTDEDSGDENIVLLHNLPGTQLRAHAEIHYGSSDSEEDDLPLHELAKRQRIDRGSTSGMQQDSQVPTTSTQPTELTTVVPKNKSYTWVSRNIHPSSKTWEDKQSVALKQTPLYYFECLFDCEIIHLFVEYTNLYATQKNKAGNVTKEEMKCFFGILLFSGYVVLPRRQMYWENASDCGMPIIFNAMSRDRFNFIMDNLHCCDNTNLQQNDKFAKIRPLLDALNAKFLNFAPFEENHSIDEAMVPYYGGHSCKQFIRGKPIRWGYKFWVGATRLGYVNWFEPYQGHSGEVLSQYRKLGLGVSVILQSVATGILETFRKNQRKPGRTSGAYLESSR
ncbi:piggyBac transposable element-derived protein 3-like, partial [Ostrinia furnacalis]|uniref:piggyBac transposable element-derived protein 3-like n=1 Tax=Ostrinia furnacalis TaxID=93504 RepID=UPI00103E6715